MGLKSHAITAETPKNLLFSAAVFYRILNMITKRDGTEQYSVQQAAVQNLVLLLNIPMQNWMVLLYL